MLVVMILFVKSFFIMLNLFLSNLVHFVDFLLQIMNLLKMGLSLLLRKLMVFLSLQVSILEFIKVLKMSV